MKSSMLQNFARLITLFFLLWHVNSNCYAQTDSSDSVTFINGSAAENIDSIREADTTALQRIAREDDSDEIGKLKRNKEFSYIHYLDSLLRNQKDIKSDTVGFDEKSGAIRRHHPRKDNSYINHLLSSTPFKIFFWLLALLFVGYLAYNLLFKNGLFPRRSIKLDLQETDDARPELVDTLKYDRLIAEAENGADYNLATRYLFLKTLRLLSEKELIHFAAEKTNHEYLREMESNPYYEEFRSLTRSYEYAWYGKFSMDAKVYQRLKDQYQVFNKNV